jgi:putative endonuclease
MKTTTDIGRAAEDCACRYLQQRGLKLLERNYHCRLGEIDLIMHDAGTTVFVEVRYRKSAKFGSGAESIDARKQRKLFASATHYLQKNKQAANQPCRFDVISLTPGALHGNNPNDIQWISNAFDAGF